MKILWVTPHFPDPYGSGGTVHQFELMRSITDAHQVTLLTPDWNIAPETLATVRDLGVRVETVAWPWHIRPRSKAEKLFRLVAGAGPTMTVWMNRARIGPLAAAIAAEQRARPVDLVLILMGELAPVLAATNAPTALLLFDVYSRIGDIVSGEVSLRAIRHRLERRNASRWEPRWYRRADAVACVSDVDAQIVSRMLGRPVEVIPNPIPDDFLGPPQRERSPATITFVGSFSWEPNMDSARWLIEEIWPQVRSRRPDARLQIVGRYAPDELRREVEAAGGELHADVEDIRPYYWDAAVVIAPIRMGSGTRNKVLHAFACRAPVVATPSALEGIPAVHGEHLLVASDSAGLADAVLEVFDDPAKARERAEAATGIAANYSSGAVGASFRSWLQTAATRRPATPVGSVRGQRTVTASVVVCTKERPELLRRCLEHVRAATAAVPGTEVIVIEQGEPSAGPICRDIGLTATVVSDPGVGVSRARNIGVRNARGDVVLFTDDDCEVPGDWVLRHVDALSDPEVSASFGEVAGLSRWKKYDPTALPSRHRRRASPWLVGHSSNMAVLRSAMIAVGGFDERLGPGSSSRAAGEDADLIVRLLRNGSVIVSGTGEAVRHIEWRSDEENRTMMISYEHGAGVWIGKAFREEPRAAFSLLRSRLDELKHATNGGATGDSSITRSSFVGALTRGLLDGIRLKPWKGPSGT